MKVVTSREELKVGDKLAFFKNSDNILFTEYCDVNIILYVVVSSLMERENVNFIYVNFVDYKGVVVMRDSTVTILHKARPRFYYYEVSN